LIIFGNWLVTIFRALTQFAALSVTNAVTFLEPIFPMILAISLARNSPV
jgi:hypothetical protein